LRSNLQLPEALFESLHGRTLFVLTAVTVLALPINMVAGLFGMNVGGIPFAGRAHGFFFIAGTLIALTGVLIYVVFGKRRD
jgi:zinc transporter